MTRKHDMKRYHSLYKRISTNWDRCYYCGDIAETLDHVPPISCADLRENHILIPCCRDCNVRLGNVFLIEIEDRCKYICKSLKRKHKKVLNMPDWTDEELDELGYNLRCEVINRLEQKKFIERRIEFLLMNK